MNEDLLYDALNEIDDRNIEHAASYKPKVKVLTTKRFLAAAACIAVVAVSATAIYSSRFKPTATPTMAAQSQMSDTYPDTTVSTNTETEIALETEIYPLTTGPVACLPAPSWEERSVEDKFSTATVEGVKYTATGDTVKYEELQRVVAYAETEGRDYLSNKTYTTTAIVYEIKTLTPQSFVAVKFLDYEHEDFFVYSSETYMPETAGNLLSDLSLSENISLDEDTKVFYEEKNSLTASVSMIPCDEKMTEKLVSLLEKNEGAKAEVCKQYEDSSEHISFVFLIRDMRCHAHFNDKGVLTLDIGAGPSFSFKLSKEEFYEVLELVETKKEQTTHLSAVTTPTTEPSTEHPDGIVTSPGYNPYVSTTSVPPEAPHTSGAYTPAEVTTASPSVPVTIEE